MKPFATLIVFSVSSASLKRAWLALNRNRLTLKPPLDEELAARRWRANPFAGHSAAAIPERGSFTQNEAIRCAHYFFCFISFAQARLARLIKQKNPTFVGLHFGGGERGIRTLDTVIPYTDFPGLLFQPLRHLSV